MDTKIVPPTLLELLQIEATLLYQFGAEIKFREPNFNVKVVRSRKTGRIKQVFLNGKYFAAIRANDGFIIPSLEGWKILASFTKPMQLPCIEILEDIQGFIAEGKTLFSKHVIRANPEILPGEEVCISSKGKIIASGKAMLPGIEMGRIKKGKAVKTR